jgi:uncharacterized membrane-anchored protein YhcB (DUF1043 family)
MKTFMKTVAVGALVVGAFCFGKAVAEFPELQASKRNLMEAKNHLNKAAKEFGGHRAKAADAVDKAIEEVDKAILYGDKN